MVDDDDDVDEKGGDDGGPPEMNDEMSDWPCNRAIHIPYRWIRDMDPSTKSAY